MLLKRGNIMKSNDSYQLIMIGLCIRLLQNSGANDKVNFIKKHFDMLKSTLSAAGFEVSVAGFRILNGIKEKLDDKGDDEEIGSEISTKLNHEMLTYERIVFSEASTKKYTRFLAGDLTRSIY